MRLKRLDLTRYGKFTEHSIDFGDHDDGQLDLHIVYGPNEAGKSTALAAFLDMLYGIETRSRFNFLHPYNTMQIGARLEVAGAERDLIRIKRAQNSLLDDAGHAVAETVISGQLGSIDRDSYRAMFSLDDDTLEAGGESILASKGNLGEVLFSASTGLAGIGRTLVDLRAEADGFYRYHARSGELAALKSRLAALKEERDRIDTAASRYGQLIEERDRARNQYDDAIARRGAIQTRLAEIQRQAGALPRLAALRTAREQLRPLADLPAAPAGWLDELPKLQRDETELSAHSEMIDDEIGRREAELDGLIVDDAALRLADQVDRLAVLHARYLTAERDIPARLLDAREEELTIAGILARIGRPGEADPARLILSASAAGVLRDLIEKRSGLDAQITSAANELATARDQLRDAQERLQAISGDNDANEPGLAAVAEMLAMSRDGDHDARRRLAERSRAAAIDELADRLRALDPWVGEIGQLAALPVPEPPIVERWKAALGAARKEHDGIRTECERLKAGRIRIEAERDAIAGIAGVVTDQDAAEVRVAREAAWAMHRRALDPDSADSFEAALRRDDIVMNARLRHEADVARLHQTNHDLARLEADARIADAGFATAAAKLRDVQDEIDAAMTRLGLNGATIDQLETWLLKRTQALETHAALRKAERDVREAEADSQQSRERLANALNAARVKHDAAAGIDALRAVARMALDRDVELRTLRADVADRQRDVKVRERNLAAVSNNDRAWNAAWLDACSTCWLGEAGSSPLLAAVREMLPALTELGPALEKRAALLRRVGDMQDDQKRFADDVGTIVLTLDIDDESPLDRYQSITDRIRRARSVLATRDTRLRELDDVRERRRILTEKRTILGKRKAEMIGYFKVASLAEVATGLADVERKATFDHQIEDATREILDALRLPSIEDAEIALDTADRAALEAEQLELQARFDDQDQRTRDLFLAHGKAVDQVETVGGDAAVAKIEEQRRTILLEIEDGARRYLRLRAGIVAAEHALRSYRRHHRSSMMAQASEAFRIISRGAYSGLASQPDKENEILIALAADGTSKVASELSKGTRFQLYLALRVAGYTEFARSHPPVPFIADDIMETFDDFRAEEAIRLLASMAKVGQVIYLTHHRHLCEIARRVCPEIRVHELSRDGC